MLWVYMCLLLRLSHGWIPHVCSTVIPILVNECMFTLFIDLDIIMIEKMSVQDYVLTTALE